MATHTDDIVRLVPQFGHVLKWVGTDAERAALARRAMQDLVSGKYPPAAPADLPLTLQSQVDKVRSFLGVFGGGQIGFRPQDIPTPPAGSFRDPLLLTVNLPDRGDEPGWLRTINAWWAFDDAQHGGNSRRSDVMIDTDHLRLSPGHEYRPGVRWVAYEKDAYAGVSPSGAIKMAASQGEQLAGAEAIMAAVLFEGYVESWYKSGNAPNLSAYQYHHDGDPSPWCRTLDLGCFGSGLRLRAIPSFGSYMQYSSPRIWEC